MKVFILLFFILFIASAETRFYKPSFNCTNVEQGTIEWLICTDEYSSRLDRELSDLYNTYRLYEYKNIKQEQKLWINNIRNKLEDRYSLNEAYKKRILELSNSYSKIVEINESNITNEEAHTLCSELTTLAENKHLHKYILPTIRFGQLEKEEQTKLFSLSKEQIEKFKYYLNSANDEPNEVYYIKLKNNEELQPFFRIRTSGTCSSTPIYNAKLMFEDGKVEATKYDEEMRWLYWGSDEYPIIYKNRNYIITTKNDVDNLELVSHVQSSGKIIPLCALQGDKKSKLKIVTSKNDNLCKKFILKELKMPSSKMTKSQVVQKLVEANATGSLVADYKQYAVEQYDITIDGNPNNLVLFHYDYASGAGCGCDNDEYWIKNLTADYKKLTESILNNMPSSFDKYPKKVYVYKNQIYINVAEPSGFDITESLIQINNEKIETICEFGEERTFPISNYFEINKNN